MKDKWFYDVYKVTEYRNGNVICSHITSWAYESLKKAREYCKQKHYVWPFYYIVRRIGDKNGNTKYKP